MCLALLPIAAVNGVCFIVGGILESVPSYLLPQHPDITDYHNALWIMPAVLVFGVVCTLLLPRERKAETTSGAAEALQTA